AEQPALRVDVLLPDFLRQQRRLAIGRKPTGQGHAISDLDRFAGRCLRLRHAGRYGCDGGCRNQGAERRDLWLQPMKHRVPSRWGLARAASIGGSTMGMPAEIGAEKPVLPTYFVASRRPISSPLRLRR